MTTVRPVRQQRAPSVTQIDAHDHESLAQAALEHVNAILYKVSMREAARLLLIEHTTLKRWMDPANPMGTISRTSAGYIVLMCETNRRILGTLDQAPRPTRYFTE